MSFSSKDKQMLAELTALHSTPGDEVQVFSYMKEHLNGIGWQVEQYGYYAITATPPSTKHRKRAQRPRILFCAHADSPGYLVDSIDCKSRQGHLIPIGYPHFDQSETDALALLHDDTTQKTKICKVALHNITKNETDFYTMPYPGMQRGDRICYLPFCKIGSQKIQATFLDNRLGCWQLLKLAENLPEDCPNDIALAITSGEEFTGFGACIVANSVPASLVVCLDTTYANKEQAIALGHGPVLTVTDKSVLLPREIRNFIHLVAEENDIPLQDEYYNFSGTDARSFPMAGQFAPVLPILIPTEGNHTPCETASLKDIDYSLKLLGTIASLAI